MIFFACFVRRSDDDIQAAEYLKFTAHLDLAADEEYLHSPAVRTSTTASVINSIIFALPSKHISSFTYSPRTRPIRLDPHEVIFLREQRLRDVKMWAMIREVCTYCVCLVLVHLVTSSRLDTNGFTQVNHLQRLFLNTRQSQCDYTQVSPALTVLCLAFEHVDFYH